MNRLFIVSVTLVVVVLCWQNAHAGIITVTWDSVTTDVTGGPESGIIYYNVYGQTFPAFPVTADNFLGATRQTSFTYSDSRIIDSTFHFYFRVIAVDEWGNASEVSEVKGTADFVLARVKVFLSAAYDASGDSMRTTLRQNGSIPLVSPYPSAQRTVPAVPDNTVDWVSVGVRSESGGSTLGRFSFFLRKDGMIVEEDGTTAEIGLPTIAAGDYYLTVEHRNHVAVMSNRVSLSKTTSLYDFTASLGNVFGGDARQLNDGVFGLYDGDANGSRGVNATDYLTVKSYSGQSGYFSADCNLSGVVNATDYLIIKPNSGKSSNIP